VLAGDVGAAGYSVANAPAEANLGCGLIVVADCVNPVAESREAWRHVAVRTRSRFVEVEIVCSDPREHRRRVEGRTSDVDGLVPPTWQTVQDRTYEFWEGPHLIIDTAQVDPDQAVAAVEAHINAPPLGAVRRT
jgi:predicted kinase